MDRKIVHAYFEKAVALVLSSAGVVSVDQQALHLLASEAERYAYMLGSHSAKIAQVSQRSKCTAADIEAAATSLGQATSGASIHVNAEAKKRLRLSLESRLKPDTLLLPPVRVSQLETNSVDVAMEGEHAVKKSNHVLPEWLQKQIDAQQHEVRESHKGNKKHMRNADLDGEGPLSHVSALVFAEEEAREILTRALIKTPAHGVSSPKDVGMLGTNS